MSDVYAEAARLEAFLGDARTGGAAPGFSFAAVVEMDEACAFPTEALASLASYGFARHVIPVACGGALTSYEGLCAQLRVISRRDLTTAIAQGVTVLGSTPVWLGGTPAQKSDVAAWLQAGDALAMGLTERAHGSDLVADEVAADPVAAGGYTLTGEKWLIGNAARSRVVCTLARTAPEGGPRGFSLFLVDKRALADGALTHLPRIPTLGIRGADIGGFTLQGAKVPDTALLGPAGGGLELTLKTLMITRVLTGAFSLGALDTALAATVDFAASRMLYGGAVLDIPHARRVVANACADLLVAEALTAASARGLQAVPKQAALSAAVVKGLLPGRVDASIADLAGVLGARHYLRDGHFDGVFQKLKRDHSLIGVFDGNTIVNLAAIAQHLPRLARGRAKPGVRESAELRARLASRHTLGAPLPALDASALDLFARADDPLLGLPLAQQMLAALGHDNLAGQAASIEEGLVAVDAAMLAFESSMTSQFKQAPESFELARRYACLYAAATGLWVWLYNQAALPEAGLALGLHRLLAEAGVSTSRPAGVDEALIALYLAAQAEGRPFGLALPLPLEA